MHSEFLWRNFTVWFLSKLESWLCVCVPDDDNQRLRGRCIRGCCNNYVTTAGLFILFSSATMAPPVALDPSYASFYHFLIEKHVLEVTFSDRKRLRRRQVSGLFVFVFFSLRQTVRRGELFSYCGDKGACSSFASSHRGEVCLWAFFWLI